MEFHFYNDISIRMARLTMETFKSRLSTGMKQVQRLLDTSVTKGQKEKKLLQIVEKIQVEIRTTKRIPVIEEFLEELEAAIDRNQLH